MTGLIDCNEQPSLPPFIGLEPGGKWCVCDKLVESVFVDQKRIRKCMRARGNAWPYSKRGHLAQQLVHQLVQLECRLLLTLLLMFRICHSEGAQKSGPGSYFGGGVTCLLPVVPAGMRAACFGGSKLMLFIWGGGAQRTLPEVLSAPVNMKTGSQ